jgi:hypothetical protein
VRERVKSLQSLTAAALFGRSKWRESREGASKWCWGPQGSLIRVCGVSTDGYFHGGFNETIGGRVRHRRPELSLILLNKVLAA